ncbi:MAG: hypothetical protein O3A88_01365 [Proteobacteria bacterium]|nr:hypothetical protein [Pseudomonadota bacterium]
MSAARSRAHVILERLFERRLQGIGAGDQIAGDLVDVGGGKPPTPARCLTRQPLDERADDRFGQVAALLRHGGGTALGGVFWVGRHGATIAVRRRNSSPAGFD